MRLNYPCRIYRVSRNGTQWEVKMRHFEIAGVESRFSGHGVGGVYVTEAEAIAAAREARAEFQAQSSGQAAYVEDASGKIV
jgi:hypothetical protein